MQCAKTYILILLAAVIASCDSDVSSDAFADSQTGQGGSMTRFAISGNYMYIVDNSSIKVYTIREGNFEEREEVMIGFAMETIFCKGDYLYLGARDAMYIYSIADREHPSFVFRYQHIVSCDPVIVQGDRAYVTLRSGNFCNRGSNALEILDISNPYQPMLIKNYPMDSPHGLGIDNSLLFLCEGERGLKVYDISDELNIKLVEHHQDFFAYDVIARQGLATVTGKDGIFQFSYSLTGNNLELVSKIPVIREEL